MNRKKKFVACFLWLNAAFFAVLSTELFAPETESHETKSALGRVMPTPPITSIIDLQPSRTVTTIDIRNSQGNKGQATLVNLNPEINVWYTLQVAWPNSKEQSFFHLENVDPSNNRLFLDQQNPDGLVVERKLIGEDLVTTKKLCDLWGRSGLEIRLARFSNKAYAPLCEGAILLRNKIEGHQSTKERVADFLRDHVWKGEQITSLVKETIFKDHFKISGVIAEAAKPLTKILSNEVQDSIPAPGKVQEKFKNTLLEPRFLGIKAEFEPDGKMQVGTWYRAANENLGVYVSVIEPRVISEEVTSSYRNIVGTIDQVEAESLSYLVAFDLDRYDAGFSLGTDNPGVAWSERISEEAKVKDLPGPDGIGTVDPLVPLGLLAPQNARRVVATFTGGFKRMHGAFKWGEFSRKNFGSHYGFIENGVVFSKLQPGLATIFMLENGAVQMKTWKESDDAILGKIRHARQNGLPIIDYDENKDVSSPGKHVNQWGPGNWSGSQDSKFRTLRAGLCLQKNTAKGFLIYGYFSCATPSTMARVFQAYGCQYALHLDMNALEHTYLALYSKKGSGDDERLASIQHLISDMKVLDKTVEGQNIPRFVGYPDNRDFFYIMKRTP